MNASDRSTSFWQHRWLLVGVAIVSFTAAARSQDQAKPDGQGRRAAARHETHTNSIGQRFVRIPRGEFDMGAVPLGDFLRFWEDVPVAERLDLLGLLPPQNPTAIALDYWMAIHEVTIGQFRAFIEASGYRTDAEKDGRGGTGLLGPARWGQDPDFTWKNYGFPVTDDHPVANVSWNDAQAFCKWLSEKEGRVYRLPTEAEWEYACRGNTKTAYFSGQGPESLEGFANVADQSLRKVTPGLPWALAFDDSHAYLAPVGSFKSNAYGLFDMHGNLLEWCQDRFSFYDPLKDLDRPRAPTGMHTLRGGNWFNDARRAGSASRSGAEPTHRMSLIGFRVVLEEQKAR